MVSGYVILDSAQDDTRSARNDMSYAKNDNYIKRKKKVQRNERDNTKIGIIEAIYLRKILEWDWQNPVSRKEEEQSEAASNLLTSLSSYLSSSSSKKSLFEETVDPGNFLVANTNFILSLSYAALNFLNKHCDNDDHHNPGILYDIIIVGFLILAKAMNDCHDHKVDDKDRSYPVLLSTIVSPEYSNVFLIWIAGDEARERAIGEMILKAGYMALIEKSLPFDMDASGLMTNLIKVYPKHRLERFGKLASEADYQIEQIDGERGVLHLYRDHWDNITNGERFKYPSHYPWFSLNDVKTQSPASKPVSALIEMKNRLDQKSVDIEKQISPVSSPSINPDTVVHEFQARYLSLLRDLKKNRFTFDAMIAFMKESKKLMDAVQASFEPLANKSIDTKQAEISTSRFRHSIRKHKLNKQLSDLTAEITNLFEQLKIPQTKLDPIFEGEKVTRVNYSYNRQEKSGFGLFQSSQTSETLTCFVSFRNGKTLTWHTLDNEKELEKIRSQYDEQLASNDVEFKQNITCR